VSVRPGYDATSVTVTFTDADARDDALELRLFDPDPLGLDDVQYTGTLSPAETARGLRLAQFEPGYAVRRAERARPRVDGFDAAAWGAPEVMPRGPIAASLATSTITLRPVRFVCRVDVSGFEGTEPVEPGPAGSDDA
jgi:hypothetical protein